jgi:hypothetical protein
MIYRSITLLISIILCIGYGQTGIGGRINGYSLFTWSDSTWNGDDNFSIAGGYTSDPFYRVTLSDCADTTFPLLAGKMIIGAETGDPLLNRYYPGGGFPNRDHRSLAEVTIRHPAGKVGYIARYRYVDTYSDLFDKYWHTYRQQTEHKMPYSNGGLASEVFTAVTFNGRRLYADASYTWFARWNASPLFCTPIYSRGYALATTARVNIENWEIVSQLCYTPTSWFYNSVTPQKYNDVDGSIYALFKPDHKSLYSAVIVEYDNRITPSVKTGCTVGISDSVKHIGASASVYSDNETVGNLFGKVRLFKSLSCSLLVGRDLRPKERSYYFYVGETPIRYQTIKNGRTIASSEIRWDKRGVLSVTSAGWLHYCSQPLWETVPVTDAYTGNLVIQQVRSPRSTRLFSGLRGNALMKWHYCTIVIRGGVVLPLDDKPLVRYHIGKTAAVDFTAAAAGRDPAKVTVSLTARDRVTLRYLYLTGKVLSEKLAAPALFSMDASLRIPVILPWVSKIFNGTAFRMSVNSLRLMNRQRIIEHPMGNKIGPEIVAGFDARIR